MPTSSLGLSHTTIYGVSGQKLARRRSADGWIADLLGIHRQTVAKGRRELLDKNIAFNRIRKEGAGRPRVEKKHRKSLRRSSS